MAATVSCPKCSKRYNLPDSTKAGRVTCRQCGTAFVVKPGEPKAKKPDPVRAMLIEPPNDEVAEGVLGGSSTGTELPAVDDGQQDSFLQIKSRDNPPTRASSVGRPFEDVESAVIPFARESDSQIESGVIPFAEDSGDSMPPVSRPAAKPSRTDDPGTDDELEPPKPAAKKPAAKPAAPVEKPAATNGKGTKFHRVGETVDKFKIEQVLGKGAMGVVYLATDTMLGRKVALKFLSADAAESEPGVLDRFLAEARSAAAIQHPNVMGVYDVSRRDDSAYMVMEYINGGSVEAMVRSRGRLEPREAARIIRDAAQGLAAAHTLGTLHRDIKPANLMLTRTGVVKVADFGLAKSLKAGATMTMSGVVLGTPHYMSPEQCRGERLDVRSDIYSLGACLFRLLAGRVPFDGDSPLTILFKQCSEPVPSVAHECPDVPEALWEVVRRAMAKEPAQRHPSMAALCDDLYAIPQLELHRPSRDAAALLPQTGLASDDEITPPQRTPPVKPPAKPPAKPAAQEPEHPPAVSTTGKNAATRVIGAGASVASASAASAGAASGASTGRRGVDTYLPDSRTNWFEPPKNQPAPTPPKPGAKGEDPLIGADLNGYRVLRRIGGGGMGTVYEAHQTALDRSVAVKVLPPKYNSDADYLVRFTREALAAAKLGHHNIVQVFDVGQAEGVHYIVMELVRGESLQQIGKRDGRLPPEKAAGHILQAARGLQYAHERGIVHRDIKPANLMLNDQGLIKVADLGLAKQAGVDESELGKKNRAPEVTESFTESLLTAELTIADTALGSLGYMSPEQMADARSVDGRADVYSLGCTFYQLLTAKLPYAGKTVHEIATKLKQQPLPDPKSLVPDLPDEVAQIIGKMLAKRPADRYQGMQEVIASIEGWLQRAAGDRFKPLPAHAEALEKAAEGFIREETSVPRRASLVGFAVLVVAVMGLSIALDRWKIFLGTGAFVIFTSIAYTMVHGLFDRSYLMSRVRQYLFGLGIADWAGIALGVIAIGTVIPLVGMTLPVLAAAGAGLAAGAAYYFGVRQGIYRRQMNALQSAGSVVKDLRLRGLREEEIHDYVAKFGGRHWESLFEMLFGYPALAKARKRLIEQGNEGLLAPLRVRDRLVRWLDGREEARRKALEAKALARVEAEAEAAAGKLSEDEKKALDERRKREAMAMQRTAAVARESAERGNRGEVVDHRLALEEAKKAAEELRAAMAAATGMAVIKGKEVEKVEAKPVSTPPVALELLLVVPRLFVSGWGRALLGAVVLCLALGMTSAENLTVDAADQVREVSAAVDVGLRQPDANGVDRPTANALFFGIALIVSGLFPGAVQNALIALGGVIAGPLAVHFRDNPPLPLPKVFTVVIAELVQPCALLGGELFVAGMVAATAGIVLWCVTPE